MDRMNLTDKGAQHPAATLLSEQDLYLYNEGSHFRIYDKLGAHLMEYDGQKGVYFAVWAPNAKKVTVVGDFNEWNKTKNPLHLRGSSGIWEGFVPGVEKGAPYKYHISSHLQGYKAEKVDPVAFHAEVPPKSASVVWDLDYQWNDAAWMKERKKRNAHDAPVSIYEMHLESWMRVPEEGNRPLTYRELAPRLSAHLRRMGFTHVELLPVMEHPYAGSWGYQSIGYFAPTSRFGTPQDFMYLVDHLHQEGIGVILDWVPSHFATDGHGLGQFDGSHLYEHADARKGFHPDWGSFIFNYGRNEVRSFLISSALYWFDKFHVDGIRVDAVASMLYLDYSRKNGEWIPNEYGGRENIEAVWLLRRLNEEVYKQFPDVQTYAEESTSWGMVSRPTYVGGLGFGFKWDMGWMHDTLNYMRKDAIHRKYHQNVITFRMLYAFHENFILPLSHDEMVHGKGSLISQMSGNDWQKFANLRLMYGYMWAQPGKKLLFMGSEWGQWREWDSNASLDWHQLDYESHEGVRRLVERCNRVYRAEPALYERDFDPSGFSWIDCNDADNSVLSFVRRGQSTNDVILVVMNCTPISRKSYRVGVPRGGWWAEILNSDASEYGGTGLGNLGGVNAQGVGWHGHGQSLEICLPPLAVLYFKSEGK
jgi:1,4-alpha-glucan branching enzyme